MVKLAKAMQVFSTTKCIVIHFLISCNFNLHRLNNVIRFTLAMKLLASTGPKQKHIALSVCPYNLPLNVNRTFYVQNKIISRNKATSKGKIESKLFGTGWVIGIFIRYNLQNIVVLVKQLRNNYL